jgi:hypothetical protein
MLDNREILCILQQSLNISGRFRTIMLTDGLIDTHGVVCSRIFRV